jgi:hypothetical protein
MGKFFLWISIVFFLGYCVFFGIRLTKIRLNYSSIKNEAERLFGPTSDTPYEQVPGKLIQIAEERSIPLSPDSVKIFIDEWDGYRALKFGYVDSITIFNFKTLYFSFSFADTVFYRPK